MLKSKGSLAGLPVAPHQGRVQHVGETSERPRLMQLFLRSLSLSLSTTVPFAVALVATAPGVRAQCYGPPLVVAQGMTPVTLALDGCTAAGFGTCQGACEEDADVLWTATHTGLALVYAGVGTPLPLPSFSFYCVTGTTYSVDTGLGMFSCGPVLGVCGCQGSPYVSTWRIEVMPDYGDCCSSPRTVVGHGPHAFDTTHATATIEGQADALCSAFGSTGIPNDTWHEWVAPATGTGFLTLCGTSVGNPKAAVRPGPGCAASPLACADDSGCGTSVLLSFPAVQGATYTFQIGRSPADPGAFPAAGTFLVDVTNSTADCDVDGLPDALELQFGLDQDCNGNSVPDLCDVASAASADCNADSVPDECQGGALTITAQPVDALVEVGASAQFTVVHTGVPPFTYQWSRNGFVVSNGAGITGATTSQLSIDATVPGDQGEYVVHVTDACGVPLASDGAELDFVAGTPFCFGDGWDAADWGGLASGPGSAVNALVEFDDGSGVRLFAATDLGVHAWNGTSWSSVGTLPSGGVRALCVADLDGPGGLPPALFAGGAFTAGGGGGGGGGGGSLRRVARWTGSAWAPLGSGSSNGTDGPVDCMTLFDAPFGLYVGGDFSSAGGTSAGGVARWDGSGWSAVAPAPAGSSRATSLAVHANELFVAFNNGAVPTRGLYRFGGSNWVPEHLVVPEIRCMASFDPDGAAGARPRELLFGSEGAGLTRLSDGLELGVGGSVHALLAIEATAVQPGLLFVAGNFASAGGGAASGLSIFDGTSLRPTLPGLREAGAVGDGRALTISTAGGTPTMYVGGAFDAAGGISAQHVAALELDSNYCPCGNVGASGRGCANSVNPSGALLRATGLTSNDSVVFRGSGMPAVASCIYLQGDQETNTVFGDGVRCAGGNLIRLRTKNNVAGASTYPEPGDPSVATRGQVTPGSGVVRSYQTYYRNAAGTFCPPATFNVTNGVRLVW